jgi:hypothetical protein
MLEAPAGYASHANNLHKVDSGGPRRVTCRRVDTGGRRNWSVRDGGFLVVPFGVTRKWRLLSAMPIREVHR